MMRIYGVYLQSEEGKGTVATEGKQFKDMKSVLKAVRRVYDYFKITPPRGVEIKKAISASPNKDFFAAGEGERGKFELYIWEGDLDSVKAALAKAASSKTKDVSYAEEEFCHLSIS